MRERKGIVEKKTSNESHHYVTWNLLILNMKLCYKEILQRYKKLMISVKKVTKYAKV